MKKYLMYTAIIFITLLSLNSCSTSVDNYIIFQNLASNKIYVNFRADLIPVESGAIVKITEIEKGTYTYSTTFDLPVGTTGTEASGAVDGTVTMKAGTKIRIIYSSTFLGGIYSISANMSSNEDVSSSGDTNPVVP